MNRYRRRVLLLTCAAALVLTAALPASAQRSSDSPTSAARSAKHAAKPAAAKSAEAPVGNPKPSLLGQYEAWGAYTATPNGRKVCFAIARPASSQSDPPNRPRDRA